MDLLAEGWRVRLLLATAVARSADVLLLDEPTNHLDAQAFCEGFVFGCSSPGSIVARGLPYAEAKGDLSCWEAQKCMALHLLAPRWFRMMPRSLTESVQTSSILMRLVGLALFLVSFFYSVIFQLVSFCDLRQCQLKYYPGNFATFQKQAGPGVR